jgi:hypothetical protein
MDDKYTKILRLAQEAKSYFDVIASNPEFPQPDIESYKAASDRLSRAVGFSTVLKLFDTIAELQAAAEAAPKKVYIVTAEANGVPQTYDGTWFHILGVFSTRDDAESFRCCAILSGEWGEYEEDSLGRITDVPLFESNWQVNLYEEGVYNGPVNFEKEVKT